MDPIILRTDELKPVLTGLAFVVPARPAESIETQIRIERSTKGELELTARSQSTSVTAMLSSPSPGEPAALLVNYQRLRELARESPSGQSLLLEPQSDPRWQLPVGDGQRLEHRCDSYPLKEFPAIPLLTGAAALLDHSTRRALTEAWQYAIKDSAFPFLDGIHLDLSTPGAHAIVASDGRQLYHAAARLDPLEHSATIPRHPFLRWKGFQEDGDWELRLSARTQNVPPLFQLTSAHWRFVAPILTGDYPDWRRMLRFRRRVRATLVEVYPPACRALAQTLQQIVLSRAAGSAISLEVIGPRVWVAAVGEEAQAQTRVLMNGMNGLGRPVSVQFHRQHLLNALQFGLVHIEIRADADLIRFAGDGREIVARLHEDSAQPRPWRRSTASRPTVLHKASQK